MAGVSPESEDDESSNVAGDDSLSNEASTSCKEVPEGSVAPSADKSFGGARPKVRRLNETCDKALKNYAANGKGSYHHGADSKAPVPSDEASEPEELVKQDNDADDFYVYVHEEHEADLPKSFYLFDASSDSESSTAHQVDPGAGPGQSNVSNEVAAALKIKRKIASSKRKRAPPGPPSGRESPDMDFLEMDFDPSESDDDEPLGNADRQDAVGPKRNRDDVKNSQERHNNNILPDPVSGLASAPLQSPADCPTTSHVGSVSMVRSQSLIYSTSKGEVPSECCMVRGESDPGNFGHPGENLLFGRWLSSVPKSPDFRRNIEKTKASIELCCERLLQRKKLLLARSGMCSQESKLKNGLIDGLSNTGEQEQALVDEHISEDCLEKVERTMIWTEAEACEKQVSNACLCDSGAAAVFNLLRALNWSHKKDQVMSLIPTYPRAETSRLPQYLFLRSTAVTTASDLIEVTETISDGKIFGRFFKMYPERNFQLNKWLGDWIKLGAIPLATSNPQCDPVQDGQTLPENWYHQMVFGVDNEFVYLTSPFESVRLDRFQRQLSGPSDLLVSRQDVLSRTVNKFGKIFSNCDLRLLEQHSDERWDRYNVLGQVVNMVRENSQNWTRMSPPLARPYESAHIRIPTIFESGVTLFVPMSNTTCVEMLKNEPEFPIKSPREEQMTRP